MSVYSVRWSMFGDATIEADSIESARKLASNDLINFSGFGLDFEDFDVAGVDIHDVEPS